MYQYFVSIGSNIHPEVNIVGVLPHLIQLSSQIHLSRVIKTEPSGGVAGGSFLNCTLCLYSPAAEKELKEQFNQIEAQMGRDRTDKNKKKKSRTIDLDILFALTLGKNFVEKEMIPAEPYVTDTLLELLTFLNIQCPVLPPAAPEGIELFFEQLSIGKTPLTLSKNLATHLVKMEDKNEPYYW